MIAYLLVEHNPEIRHRIARELKEGPSAPVEVVDVDNGEAALARLRECQDIDLVLLDLDLGPGRMKGMEVLREIRRTSRIPVVVYAAQPSAAEFEVEARERGATSFLDEGAFAEKGYLASYLKGLLEVSASAPNTYLLVEDNPETRHGVARELKEGSSVPVEVIAVDSGEAALARFGLRQDIDLVLLDLDLGPGRMKGMEVLREIRRSSQVPVVIYTVDTKSEQEVEAWELSVDGYLDKNKFGDNNFLVRRCLEAKLKRRKRGEGRECYSFDGWTLDADRRQLINPAGAEVVLSDSEFDLLLMFMRKPGEVLTLEELIGEHGFESAKDPASAFAQRLSRLKRKTTGDGDAAFIRNIYGQGYKFTATITQGFRP